ncbi:MAG: tetratricopeptide repeat protein [Rhizomicrobium sp.]
MLAILAPASASPPEADAVAAALRGGNASSAVARATQALEDPALTATDRARVLMDRGLAHEMLGEHDAALVDFTVAINGHDLPHPEQARALYNRGVALDELGRTEDAAGDYTAAIGLDPHFAAALNNRGNAWRRLGKLAEARADYQASIAAGNPHPEYPDYGLGQMAEAAGDGAAARTYYRAALAANPQFALARQRLAALAAAPAIPSKPVADHSAADAPVVLKPPPDGPADAAPAPDGDAPIHLRPPRGMRPDDAPIQLKPPETIQLKPPPHRRPGATVDLKPAISDGGPAGARQIVQLGAWRSQADAAIAWSRIARATGEALAGLTPQIVAVDLPGKGRYYRLRTGPADPGLCAVLRARGAACVPVKD